MKEFAFNQIIKISKSEIDSREEGKEKAKYLLESSVQDFTAYKARVAALTQNTKSTHIQEEKKSTQLGHIFKNLFSPTKSNRNLESSNNRTVI